MSTWHRKRIGLGSAVYQDLRELCALRLTDDKVFGLSSLFRVAFEVKTDDMFAYLPPGSDAFAKRYGAEPCDAPNFDNGSLRLMSDEDHPAQPPVRTMTAKGEVVEDYRFHIPNPAILEGGIDPDL